MSVGLLHLYKNDIVQCCWGAENCNEMPGNKSRHELYAQCGGAADKLQHGLFHTTEAATAQLGVKNVCKSSKDFFVFVSTLLSPLGCTRALLGPTGINKLGC